MRFGICISGSVRLGLPCDRAVPSTPLSTSLKLPARPLGVRVECASESASQALRVRGGASVQRYLARSKDASPIALRTWHVGLYVFWLAS